MARMLRHNIGQCEVSLYSCPPKNPQMEALKNTYIDKLKFYTLKIPLEAKITPKNTTRPPEILILKPLPRCSSSKKNFTPVKKYFASVRDECKCQQLLKIVSYSILSIRLVPAYELLSKRRQISRFNLISLSVSAV